MFFDDNNNDIDVILSITDKLSTKDAVNFLSANKRLNKILQSKKFWMGRFGVESYKDFKGIYDQIQEYPDVIWLIKSGIFKMDNFDDVIDLLRYSPDKRKDEVLRLAGLNIKNEDQLNLLRRNPDVLKVLTSDMGIVALAKNYITFEYVVRLLMAEFKQMESFNYHFTQQKLFLLLSDDGFEAVRDKFISLETMLSVHATVITTLMVGNGLKALRGQLITAEEAEHLSSERGDRRKLLLMLSDNGILALQEKLISPENARQLTIEALNLLVSEAGLNALRNRWIAPEEAGRLDLEQLKKRISEEGIEGSRKNADFDVAKTIKPSRK